MGKISNVILAAGAPQFGSEAPSIEEINKKYNVIQWALKVLSKVSKPFIITGYDFNKINNLNLSANILYNDKWNTSKSAYSLSLAP